MKVAGIGGAWADADGGVNLTVWGPNGLVTQNLAGAGAQVAGMVLLDATAPKPRPARPSNADPNNLIGRVAALTAASAHLGVARDLGSAIEEYGVANTSMEQASALTSLDGKPLIVVTADKGVTDDQWQSKQNKMAALSTNSLHRHCERHPRFAHLRRR